MRDRVLVSILKRRAAKGEQIFPVSDSQMRNYFDGLTNGRFKRKDLRTLSAHRLAKQSDGSKKEIAKVVSAELGNTPAVAIKSYVDPKFINASN